MKVTKERSTGILVDERLRNILQGPAGYFLMLKRCIDIR